MILNTNTNSENRIEEVVIDLSRRVYRSLSSDEQLSMFRQSLNTPVAQHQQSSQSGMRMGKNKLGGKNRNGGGGGSGSNRKLINKLT